jgi:hypothetical protein
MNVSTLRHKTFDENVGMALKDADASIAQFVGRQK